MSLEQAISDNTAAIRDLIGFFQNNNAQVSAPVPPPAKEIAAPAKAAKGKARKEEAPIEAPPADAPAGPTLQEIAKAVTDLSSKKGRQAVLDLLAVYGKKLGSTFTKASEIPAEHLAAFVKDAQDALAAEESLV